MNGVCLLVQMIPLMWVEGEERQDSGGQRAAKEAVQGKKEIHSRLGQDSLNDFSHLTPYVFIPSDRLCADVFV